MKKIIVINFIIIILVFLTLEGFIRIFNFASVLGHSENLFYTDNNITLLKKNVSGSIFGKKVYTDTYGFRVPKLDYEYNSNSNKILLLGDSVSFGVGVNEEDTFIGLWRNNTNDNLFNASVSGHNSSSYSKLLDDYSIKFPNLSKILIFICLNDIVSYEGVLNKTNLNDLKKTKNFNFIKNLRSNIFLVKLNFFLRDKSALYVFLKSVLSNPPQRYFEEVYPLYLNKKLVTNLQKNFLKIKKLVEINDLNLQVIILPYSYQVEEENCNNQKKFLPQLKIKEILNDHKFDYIDFTNDFCNKKNTKQLFLKHDPMHLSEFGHKFVFELLKRRINL